jgi:hypothetical protein
MRHFTPSPGADGKSQTFGTIPTALQGYGIFLDIKNMEYKNLDDAGKVLLSHHGNVLTLGLPEASA